MFNLIFSYRDFSTHLHMNWCLSPHTHAVPSTQHHSHLLLHPSQTLGSCVLLPPSPRCLREACRSFHPHSQQQRPSHRIYLPENTLVSVFHFLAAFYSSPVVFRFPFSTFFCRLLPEPRKELNPFSSETTSTASLSDYSQKVHFKKPYGSTRAKITFVTLFSSSSFFFRPVLQDLPPALLRVLNAHILVQHVPNGFTVPRVCPLFLAS